MENAGIMPVMDMRNNNDTWGGGMWFMWIIVLFALMGGWGNGWGNNRNNNGFGYDVAATFANGSMTREQVADEFAYNDIKNGVRGVQNGLCDGFYAQNTTMLNGFNGVQRDICYRSGQLEQGIMQTGYQLGNQIAENRYASQQCCCETQKSIAAMSAENYKNTCEVVNAINADGEKTRALMVANQIQDLRDKLADRDRDLQTATFQLSQVAQSANLIGALRPFPQPAYITTSPYQSAANTICGCGGYNSVA